MKETPKFLLEDISYTYNGHTYALQGINLSIYPRQITAIFGPA
ncbi:MAG TPA: phosphate ABC transporter ATP-binding protein, partial [Anaerolineae bacterium]|nr:phosphate ABC transporter ATP-binding protein [Anaerolineae bacterium]